MDAVERFEQVAVERLDPERDTIKTRRAEHFQVLNIHCAGVSLSGDFGLGRDRQRVEHRSQQRGFVGRRNSRRRAAAEEDGIDRRIKKRRLPNLLCQCADVANNGSIRVAGIRIEVAVGALADTKRNVNIAAYRLPNGVGHRLIVPGT